MGWPVEGSSWSIYPILPAVLVGNEAFSLTGIKRTTRSSHHALVLPRARAEKNLRQGRGLRAFTINSGIARWRKLSSIGTTGRPGRSAPHTSGRSLSRPARFHTRGSRGICISPATTCPWRHPFAASASPASSRGAVPGAWPCTRPADRRPAAARSDHPSFAAASAPGPRRPWR